VSGEYAMLKAAAERGWLNEKDAALEALMCFRRCVTHVLFCCYTHARLTDGDCMVLVCGIRQQSIRRTRHWRHSCASGGANSCSDDLETHMGGKAIYVALSTLLGSPGAAVQSHCAAQCSRNVRCCPSTHQRACACVFVEVRHCMSGVQSAAQ
jgi:hypothetical protein